MNNDTELKTKQTDENNQLVKMSLAALGIVFGDISTSPIYAIRECFHGEYGIVPTYGNITGVLSLMFWTLVMIVGMKYLIFVFRADNKGEGGVIALTALIRGEINRPSKGRTSLGIVTLGLFAACLLYGDGMITPAISVMSAVEGIGIVTPMFESYAIPPTIVILCGLFLIQRHGTAKVGGLFGPVILVWLSFLGITGGVKILQVPKILAAIFPWYAIRFLFLNKIHGYMVLGAVFLVVTGIEALYADMGHFGKQPIRLTWFMAVFPALILNYFGQGALLLGNPEAAGHPFYAMVPSWAMWPTVLLHFQVEDIPRVPNLEKIKTEKLGSGFYRIIARYGFMEDPRLENALTLARGQGLELDLDTLNFYLGRERLVARGSSKMGRWRTNIFVFMSRNAADAAAFFSLPADKVIEIGVQLEI